MPSDKPPEPAPGPSRALLPCPFCGRSNLITSHGTQVLCGDCGACGPHPRRGAPINRTMSEAKRDAWNLRPPEVTQEPAPTLEEAVRRAVKQALNRDHYRRYISVDDAATDVVPEVMAAITRYDASRSPSTTVGEGPRKTASEVVGWISSVGHQDLSDAAKAPVDGNGGDRG